jgi:hypothetical protein
MNCRFQICRLSSVVRRLPSILDLATSTTIITNISQTHLILGIAKKVQYLFQLFYGCRNSLLNWSLCPLTIYRFSDRIGLAWLQKSCVYAWLENLPFSIASLYYASRPASVRPCTAYVVEVFLFAQALLLLFSVPVCNQGRTSTSGSDRVVN